MTPFRLPAQRRTGTFERVLMPTSLNAANPTTLGGHCFDARTKVTGTSNSILPGYGGGPSFGQPVWMLIIARLRTMGTRTLADAPRPTRHRAAHGAVGHTRRRSTEIQGGVRARTSSGRRGRTPRATSQSGRSPDSSPQDQIANAS